MKRLFKILDYHFKNPALIEQALTHRSAASLNNERLEFLGDAVLNCIVAALLYEHLPKAHEGELSRLRSSMVNQEFLAEIAKQLDLGHYLILGQGELKSGGVHRKSILSDALEAIIGAVYLDGGFEACQLLLKNWFGPHINSIHTYKLSALKDAKSSLQEYCQANRMDLPLYTIISITGVSHHQIFWVSCKIKGIKFQTEGQGSSRREAEQKAAEIFLHHLKQV